MAAVAPAHAGASSAPRDWLWLLAWAALLLVPLLLRGPLPPDEVRYLSVAWEMWSRGDALVPHLNGLPYSDKPPLLFWLMQLGWLVTGVNDWWPRALPALFALSSILVARSLCRALWPERPEIVRLVPWLLLGTLAWSIYTQVVLFDLLLVNWTLLGLLGLIRADRGDGRGWIVVAAATGLGLLTKGPAMFLHLAGAGLLRPWWSGRREGAGAWYLRFVLALLAGGAVALAWAVPAALSGGPAYASEILLGQTAGRMVDSFAHARPFWFYLWMLPLLMLPWSLWPRLWSALRRAWPAARGDRSTRLLLATIVPTLVAFSAVSGKQPHYVLPLVPLLCALLAMALDRAWAPDERLRARVPALAAAAVTLLFGLLPTLAGDALSVAPWSPVWGAAGAALILALAGPGRLQSVVPRLALTMPILVLSAEAGFFLANGPAFDLSAAAVEVRELQSSGRPVAYVGDYNGDFHFLGRLTEPLPVIEPNAIQGWAAEHRDGYLVGRLPETGTPAIFEQQLRGKPLVVVEAARVGSSGDGPAADAPE